MDSDEPVDPSDELLFTCLGGGNEVGRSCHIIQYKGKTVMLDTGMHPAHDGFASLPYFDEFDLGTVDVLLISHFHVDHAAALPYVLSKTNFKGRVFMTPPTKAIYKWLIQDTLRVGNLTSSAEQNITLYSEADHLNTFNLIETIDFYAHETASSISITAYPAGHVLGAAMYLIDIAGLKILFTGDYSREEDRHLVKASVPKDVHIDVLICESTFGTSLHVPRAEREVALMKGITGIIERGGRALLPVFALGTAQELLLILDEYWSRHAKYQKTPIYYASNLARRCMQVYQTYLSAMNDNMKELVARRVAEAERAGRPGEKAGPWDFQFVRALKSLERFEDAGPCVMLASPGMMQSGASRELLERWAPDERNGVVITGYSVEGTMAQQLLNEPEYVTAVMTRKRDVVLRRGAEEVRIPRRCSIQETSFAAHVDGQQNREFVEEVDPEVVILVHGARHMMTRFKTKLLSLNPSRSKPLKVFSPANCEELRIPFKRDKFAKAVGHVVQLPSSAADGFDEIDSGLDTADLLVQNDLNLTFMAAKNFQDYAAASSTTIATEKRFVCSAGVDLIRWGLEGMFGEIEQLPAGSSHTRFLVMDAVTVDVAPGGQVVVGWESSLMNDNIADSVLAVMLQMETGIVGVKRSGSASPHGHAHNPHTSEASEPHVLARLLLLLENQFTSVTPLPDPSAATNGSSAHIVPSPTFDDPVLEIAVPPHVAHVHLRDLRVESTSNALRTRVAAVVEKACEAVVGTA